MSTLISVGPLFQHNLEYRLLFGGATANAAWPVANLALYTPVRIPKKMTISGLWWLNGGTAAGNVCMGLYDEGGNLLIDTGIVAQSGASVIQMPSITAFELKRGRYWMGLVLSSITGTIRGCTPAAGMASAKWMAIGEEALGSTQLPTTMNPSASDRRPPILGLMRG